jgi:hypothetical protein
MLKKLTKLTIAVQNEEVLLRARTLSDDLYYRGCSPVSKSSSMAFNKRCFPPLGGCSPTHTQEVSPTPTQEDDTQEDDTLWGSPTQADFDKMYIRGNEYERSILAHYGIVSYDYHKKNNEVEQKTDDEKKMDDDEV